MFSLIEVLLNFLKYLRSASFPSMVVSAFSGLVLYLCQDFGFHMTGSMFDVFVIILVQFFLLLVEKCFQFPILIKVFYLVSQEG